MATYKDVERIEKSVLLVIMTFAQYYKVGICKSNRTYQKKYGRTAKSISTYGLYRISNVKFCK